MAAPDREPERPDSKILTKIVEALAKRPEYLLIFAICFLLMTLSSGAFAWVISQSPEDAELYIAASIGGLVIGLVFAYLTIRQLNPLIPPDQRPDDPARPRAGDAPLETIAETDDLGEMACNIAKALESANEVLREELEYETQQFRAEAARWANGELRAPAGRYEPVLLALYRNAKESVFSTSIPEYLSTWRGKLGEEMIEAHRQARAMVTRVFVFDDLRDIDEESLAEMKRQVAERIGIRVYIDSEYSPVVFSPQVSKDFTIVDDEAVGVTRTFTHGHLEATWHFSKDEVKTFRRIQEALLLGSKPLEEIEARIAR